MNLYKSASLLGFVVAFALGQPVVAVYHAGQGRWLQRDSVGYVAGANLYLYGGGNAVGATDPSGLIAVTPPPPAMVAPAPAVGEIAQGLRMVVSAAAPGGEIASCASAARTAVVGAQVAAPGASMAEASLAARGAMLGITGATIGIGAIAFVGYAWADHAIAEWQAESEVGLARNAVGLCRSELNDIAQAHSQQRNRAKCFCMCLERDHRGGNSGPTPIGWMSRKQCKDIVNTSTIYHYCFCKGDP